LDQGEETLQPYCQGERCFCGKACGAQGPGNDLLRQPAANPPPAHELHLVQRIGLTHAVPVDGRGRRSNTLLLIRTRGVCRGRKASIDPAKVKALKAEGMGPSAIAKTLKIGRASVYRALEN
jgi:hypothetical protein